MNLNILKSAALAAIFSLGLSSVALPYTVVQPPPSKPFTLYNPESDECIPQLKDLDGYTESVEFVDLDAASWNQLVLAWNRLGKEYPQFSLAIDMGLSNYSFVGARLAPSFPGSNLLSIYIVYTNTTTGVCHLDSMDQPEWFSILLLSMWDKVKQEEANTNLFHGTDK